MIPATPSPKFKFPDVEVIELIPNSIASTFDVLFVHVINFCFLLNDQPIRLHNLDINLDISLGYPRLISTLISFEDILD